MSEQKPIELENIQVEIPVAQLNRAKRFYEKIFGFVVKSESYGYVEFDNNVLLAEYRSDKIGKYQGPSPQLLFWVRNISVAYREAQEAGVAIESPPQEMGDVRFFQFYDSEGNECRAQQVFQ